MARREARIKKHRAILSVAHMERMAEIEAIEDSEERLSEYLKYCSGLDTSLKGGKLKREDVKDRIVSMMQGSRINEAVASTSRTAGVLTYPLGFSIAANNPETAARVRSTLIRVFGREVVRGAVKRVRKVMVSTKYEISEELRDKIHAAGPELELEIALMIGSPVTLETGRPSKRLLSGAERRRNRKK